MNADFIEEYQYLDEMIYKLPMNKGIHTIGILGSSISCAEGYLFHVDEL